MQMINKRKLLNVPALVVALALLLPALAGAYPAEVARTGQTTCYNEAGDNITCTGMGQDGDRLAGVAWPDPRFTVQSDNQTVTDNLTGLMWTKNANLPNGPVTWQDALNYVADMNAGTYPNFGYTDWRLPNVNELESLVNAELYNPALPLNHPFINVKSYYYWSSTSFANYTLYAWMVHMTYGFVNYDSKTAFANVYVWPVRAGQCVSLDDSIICLPRTGQTTCYADNGTIIGCTGTGQDGDLLAGVAWPDPRFSVQSDTQSVTDNVTGLMWARNANLMVTRDPTFDTDSTANDGGVTWQHALDYIKKLNSEQYLNYTDWRLPNTRELGSLADYELYGPVLPSSHPFTNVQSSSYWSSTSAASYTYYAWFVGMNYGYVLNGNKTGVNFVWPVRAGQSGSFNSSTTTTSVGSTTSVPTTTTIAITTSTTTIGGTTTTTTVPRKLCPAKSALGENNPKLENLRDFRDSKLAQSAVGRMIINNYYNNSDSINAALDRSPALRTFARRVLEVIAPMVGKN
jgi:hypothetical protein